ncbi:2Fe-2S iron-sulfur cluster-binding protein [Paenibacillus sp. JX-17]|uniref:2Fe-2S iron-sulfur cluster-binding protein n=1 Tax=Paenibacillus lacisoli TaxID=3064525 RepID=A0ABT9C766_9BACL|nr:2Fe-2S iron-sulfur cluster-binding protein [Paenibacillus sp. JX-17]MDO7905085.1 2Fe-2S iron-sulfur cluster-binding protein [Paenibacillus sp. JX-17]
MAYSITFLPAGKQAQVKKDTTVLQAARRAAVPIQTRCDGKMGCLMCKVKLPDGMSDKVSPPSPGELLKLGGSVKDGIRLSCQAKIRESLTVEVPEDRLKAAVRKQLEQQQEDTLW